MIDAITHAFAAAFLIFWGSKMETSGSNLFLAAFMYLVGKVAPVLVGILFAFNLYARFMGWPV